MSKSTTQSHMKKLSQWLSMHIQVIAEKYCIQNYTVVIRLVYSNPVHMSDISGL